MPGMDFELNEFVIAADNETFLNFDVSDPAPRWLSFNYSLDGPLGSLDEQTLEFFLNNKKLEVLKISETGWAEYRIFLPRRLQKQDQNALAIRLVNSISVQKNNISVFGYFRDIKFFFGNKNDRRTLKTFRKEAFKLLNNNSQLLQYTNSSIRFGVQLGSNPKISLVGQVQSNSQSDQDLTVELNFRTDQKPEWQTLDRVTVTTKAGNTREINLTPDLTPLAASIAEIEIKVRSPKPYIKSGVCWEQTLLTGIINTQETANNLDIPKHPENIILIILDASRADGFGYISNNKEVTPYINSFAEEAVRFNNATSPTSFTGSSVSSLFTGMTPEAHGFLQPFHIFPEEIVTLPELLQQNGFYTANFTGNPIVVEKSGIGRNFDQEIIVYPGKLFKELTMWHDEELIVNKLEEINKSDKPKFLYFHLMPPHYPYNPPAPYNKRFGSDRMMNNEDYVKVDRGLAAGIISQDDPRILAHHQLYLNNLSYGDHLVETILEKLKKLGIYQKSLVIITADHAEAFGEHNTVKHYKTVYEEMIRIPMLVKMPGIKPVTITSQVGLEDIFATINQLYQLGYQSPALRSSSLLPFMMNGDSYRPVRQYYRRASVLYPFYALRGDRFKFVRNRFTDELYDLIKDPKELNNLAGSMPALTSYLRTSALLVKLQDEKLKTTFTLEEHDEKLEEDLKNLGYLN